MTTPALISPDDITAVQAQLASTTVLGVQAPTGSGKSTELAASFVTLGQARVFVVEPTIQGTISVYRRMKQQLAALGPSAVGYAAESEVHYTDSTKLIYCTSGHLRRKMLTYFINGKLKPSGLDFCDVLILDEAHSGNLDLIEIQIFYKHALDNKQPEQRVPYLLFASATLSMTETLFPNKPLYTISRGLNFPVEVRYHTTDFRSQARDLYTSMVNVIKKFHVELPVPVEGDVWLAFASGAGEVQTIVAALNEEKSILALPAYSELAPEAIERIYQPPPANKRVVIVATNIAETSITINNLSGVFDSMVEKYRETNLSGALILTLDHVSKASAQQRKGRTGRTRPGFCYRMCTQSFYDKRPENRPSELIRAPLTNMLIELLSVSIDPLTMLPDPAVHARLKHSVDILRQQGAVESDAAGNQTVAPLGNFAAVMPLSIYGSATLFKWLAAGTSLPPFPGVVLVSLVDSFNQTYYYFGEKKQSESIGEHIERFYRENTGKLFTGPTDLHVLIGMWTSFNNEVLAGQRGLRVNQSKINAWASKHLINAKKWRDAFTIIRQVANELTRLRYQVQLGAFSDRPLVVLSPILDQVYATRVFNKKGRDYFDPRDAKYYQQSKLLRSVELTDPKIIALSFTEVGGRGRLGLSFPYQYARNVPVSPAGPAGPAGPPLQPPSVLPSVLPSILPSVLPSVLPSILPSVLPPVQPSVLPPVQPSVLPSVLPSILPSVQPSQLPPFQPPSVLPAISVLPLPTPQPTANNPVLAANYSEAEFLSRLDAALNALGI